MSAVRYFVDTNLLLYGLDEDAPLKATRAVDWLNYLWHTDAARVSWQVLHEFYWNATRKMGVPVEHTRNLVRSMIQWKPLEADAELIERGWHWIDAAQITYWDSMIVAAAERLSCDVLLSEDFQSGRTYGAVRAVNPFKESPPPLSVH
jgi:predicted nucleic acid-binding protein